MDVQTIFRVTEIFILVRLDERVKCYQTADCTQVSFKNLVKYLR